MPSKRKYSSPGAVCQHSNLCLKPSPYADIVGYDRPSPHQLIAAAQISGRVPARSKVKSVPFSAFPAPLVLPGDDLAYDSNYPGQSLCAWNRHTKKSLVTSARSTIYVVAPPDVSEEVEFLHLWSRAKTPQPKLHDVVSYLKAFYTGLRVEVLRKAGLQFRRWDDEDEFPPRKSRGRQASKHPFPAIGLQYNGSEALHVRARPCADAMFPAQMNLDDIIDACLEILPDDALAMTMILPYDLFESDDDDFCCGRAYGGSRVSVVSTARYNPDLDIKQAVETEHAWPLSHCNEYIAASCAAHEAACHSVSEKRKTSKNSAQIVGDEAGNQDSPLHAAVKAVDAMSSPVSFPEKSNLWLSRVCKTASHELGHCLGIDHCPYYACIMQGTAGLSEDARQPPYLCPIDLAKVLRVTGSSEMEHLMALREFCQGFCSDRLFRGFDAWLEARLSQLQV